MNKQLSGPVVAVILVLVVAAVGIFLYKAANSGIQGDGKVGNVEAAPPMGPGAQEGLKNLKR